MGISKTHLEVLAHFFASCEAGKNPQVQTQKRREAILKLSEYVKCTGSSISINNKALPTSGVRIGNAGITEEMRQQGYVGTIGCSVEGDGTEDNGFVFQSLHITMTQLLGLRENIDMLLDDIKRNPELGES